MALHPDIFAPVMEAMHAGHLVLTPNHRTRVQLLDAYGPWRQSRGLSPVCATPAVYPVDIWLRRLWLDLEPATGRAAILEPALETLVWQDIVRASEAGAGLVNQRATARAVQEAWRLAHLWRIDMTAVRKLAHFQKSGDIPDDLSAFLSWVDAFEAFCRKQALISLSPLVETVIADIAAGDVRIPGNILLTGFDNPPPLYADLIGVLINSSSNVTRFSQVMQSPGTRLEPCRDDDEEGRRAATWARQILDTVPAARIGIICPDLQRQSAMLRRHFRTILDAGRQAAFDNRNQAFSLGATQSLADSPLLATALDVLSLNTTWVETLTLCRMLRSPFTGSAGAEEGGRAWLERRLRDTGEMKVQLAWVRELANDADAPCHCKGLAAALLEFDSLRRALPHTATLQVWSSLFESQLAALGWPGERRLDKTETTGFKAWSRVLKNVALMSPWHGEVNLAQALAILQQLLAGSSPDADDDLAPVQILSPLEADGLVFTHTWILGMSEQQWPPPARPVPFIPLNLQKAQGMPGSDIPGQTEAARRQLDRFRGNTMTEIVFSWPQQEEDLVLKPAGMLAAIGAIPDSAEALSHPHARFTGAQTGDGLELLTEPPHIPLLDTEQPAGGTALMADQADCPFRAFAVHRLKVEPLSAPVIGLPGHVLGSIMHEALDILWRHLQDQAGLVNCDSNALAGIVRNAVTAAVSSKARFYRHTMTAQFNAMEIRRLTDLLLAWLEEEKKRGTFRVAASEHRLQWQHAGLTLTLRIDRLDETADGKRVVVDYKSSKSGEINWFDPRQTEPQLMLYMLAVEAQEAAEVDGLFIAQVNVEEIKYKGISDDDGIYPKSHYSAKRNAPESLTWQQLRQSWQDSLTAIANEFLAGYVAVAPKSVNSSCTWCHLGPFCRIGDGLTP